MSGAISYYDLQLQKVNEVGISGTESIAKETLVWRQNNYAPLAQNVLNFVTWSTNQTFFTAAENRLVQIKTWLSSPLFSESPDVQNDYEEAAASLKTAEDQNTAAKNAFAQSLSSGSTAYFIEQSLDSFLRPISTSSTSAPHPIPPASLTARRRIKNTLLTRVFFIENISYSKTIL